MDGEDGVRARALHVHLCAGRGARQGAHLQALHHLEKSNGQSIIIITTTVELKRHFPFENGESPSTFLKMSKSNTNLSCRRDGARGHTNGVDASVGVLVDLDVGSLFSGFGVSCCVEQIQHFFVVQLERMLENKETQK